MLTYLYSLYVLSFYLCFFYYLTIVIISCLKSSLEWVVILRKKCKSLGSMGVERVEKVLRLSSFLFFLCQNPWFSFKLHLLIACEHFRKKSTNTYTKVQTLIFLTQTFPVHHRHCPLPFRFPDRVFLLLSYMFPHHLRCSHCLILNHLCWLLWKENNRVG